MSTLLNIAIMGSLGAYLGWNSNWGGFVCVAIAYVTGALVEHYK